MAEPNLLHVLLAPIGQLSGNGQLRETLIERRRRKGADVPFWYLSPALEKFDLPGKEVEAIVAGDSTAIQWLKLRFGGESFTAQLDIDQLRELAMELPPAPTIRDISSK